MSGLRVLSTISTLIEYQNESITIYDTNIPIAPKPPPAFSLTCNHLPIIRHILFLYKADLVTSNIKYKPSDFCEHLCTPLEGCEIKAWKTKQIFERILSADDLTWEESYTKCIGVLDGAGNTIVELMFSLTELVQSVVCDYAVVSMRSELILELEGIRGKMECV